MIAPVSWRTRSSRIVRPAAGHVSCTSICAMWRSGPAAVVTVSRNAVTCGRSTRFAICGPAAVYGMTTRSAPASCSFFFASSSEARATICRSGRCAARRQRDVEVVGVVVGGDDEAACAVETRASRGPRPRSPFPSIRRSPCSFAAATASSLEVEHDVGDAGMPELLGHAPADAAVAADDEVVVHAFDRSLPPPLGQRAREHAARYGLDDNGARVADDRQRRASTSDDRERARRVARWHGVEPGRARP